MRALTLLGAPTAALSSVWERRACVSRRNDEAASLAHGFGLAEVSPGRSVVGTVPPTSAGRTGDALTRGRRGSHAPARPRLPGWVRSAREFTSLLPSQPPTTAPACCVLGVY